VLHPSTAPQVVSTGAALEFLTSDELILPPQRRLKNELVRLLSEFAGKRSRGSFSVESTLRVERGDGVEFPASYVVRLSGAGVTEEDVKIFQTAARLLLSRMTTQTDLWNQPAEGMLQAEDLDVLQPMAGEFARQFSGSSIRQGVMVRLGSSDSEPITIKGRVPALILQHRAPELVSGTARPIGFDEEKNFVALSVNSVGEDQPPRSPKRLEILCPTPVFLRTLATAYANRSMVEFQAFSQLEATSQRPILTLRSLKEIDIGPESYELR